MRPDNARPSWGTSQELTSRVIRTVERFVHIEAVSGGFLIAAGIAALFLANSPLAASYDALWHAPITLGVGAFSTTQPLHFFVNEVLMTIFFLVAGLEIRRELHEGALADKRLAILPITAALGGVLVPAAIYVVFNPVGIFRDGWAVPVATDIAFALGVLALLGRSIPSGVRVFLLALAIIDDIIAVAIIAVFYTEELRIGGGLIAVGAISLVLLFQRLGVRMAAAYVLPGSLLWFGLWTLGVHPTVAGVILGLLTPVVPLADRTRARTITEKLAQAAQLKGRELAKSLRHIQLAERDLIPPVVTVEAALHPWVAYAILPLFAFANAGITLGATDLVADQARSVAHGVAVGLLLGKPVGILCASAIALRLRWCALPADVGWRGLILVGVLGGIGFTMSIFIANLAFDSVDALETAKLGILLASAASAVLGLALGKSMFHATVKASGAARPAVNQGD
jgi:NhaA family Na+:H+ antiporter